MIDPKKLSNEKVDILAFGAHPDDIEDGCGGLLVKAAKRGYSTGIIDMSLGELSTNGTVEERQKEAQAARKILGAKFRENLEVPNNFFFNSRELQDVLVKAIRAHKPEMVLVPYYFDRHPDHMATGNLVREALFTSGLIRYETGQEKHRPTRFLFYMMWNEFQPSFILDITDEFDTKMKALLAHTSQFGGGKGTRKTIDNDADTLKFFEARARNYGFPIAKRYGEPYLSINPIGLDDPMGFIPNFF